MERVWGWLTIIPAVEICRCPPPPRGWDIFAGDPLVIATLSFPLPPSSPWRGYARIKRSRFEGGKWKSDFSLSAEKKKWNCFQYERKHAESYWWKGFCLFNTASIKYIDTQTQIKNGRRRWRSARKEKTVWKLFKKTEKIIFLRRTGQAKEGNKEGKQCSVIILKKIRIWETAPGAPTPRHSIKINSFYGENFCRNCSRNRREKFNKAAERARYRGKT